ncbi:G-protein coupled receptor 4-like [Sander vitreus]
MEDVNNISQDMSYGYYSKHFETSALITQVVTCIIICIGLLLILVAIYALYSLVRKDHVAPIYVINLLISDLIQLCCMIGWVAKPKDQKIDKIVILIYGSSLMASVCFMVCIALERYLVIACPLWYRFRRTIKISVMVCVLVWIISLVFLVTQVFCGFSEVTGTILAIFFLLPLPLLIFFLVGTLKALSASISVHTDEKRRIVGMLVLVLLIYMLLFLPRIIFSLTNAARPEMFFIIVESLSFLLFKLSPLADLVLYVFMRKGAIDKLLASVCV